MEPLISIVIPTRNRSKYCIAAIEDILSYDYPYLQLCVQDNSDDVYLKEYIMSRKNDPRLIYKYVPEQLAFIFNVNDSIELATGKYVIMIGDDDTILPSLFEVVEYMDKMNIDSLCSIPIINYYWPGAHPQHQSGYLTVPKQFVEYNEVSDVDKKLKKLFQKGTIRYLKYNLPKLYHGIVKREILENIKNKTGHYAGGLTPDIYLSIAISTLVSNHYTTNFAFSIAGACTQSATSQDLNKGHRGLLKDAPHFNLRGDYEWDSLIPDYYSIDTIWGETALKAAAEMDMPMLRESFNFNYMAAFSLLYNRSIFDIAYKHTFNKWKGIKKSMKICSVGLSASSILATYIFNRFKNRFKKKELILEYEPVENISDASKLIKI